MDLSNQTLLVTGGTGSFGNKVAKNTFMAFHQKKDYNL